MWHAYKHISGNIGKSRIRATVLFYLTSCYDSIILNQCAWSTTNTTHVAITITGVLFTYTPYLLNLSYLFEITEKYMYTYLNLIRCKEYYSEYCYLRDGSCRHNVLLTSWLGIWFQLLYIYSYREPIIIKWMWVQ